MPEALRHGRLHAALWPGIPAGPDAVLEGMRAYRGYFERLDTTQNHALLVAFPAVGVRDVGWVVEDSQRRLKTEFVERGLMIGEFHPGPPPAPGLHNPSFRPLHSPVPLLAIRRMVGTDLPFLTADEHHLEVYRAHFSRTEK